MFVRINVLSLFIYLKMIEDKIPYVYFKNVFTA